MLLFKDVPLLHISEKQKTLTGTLSGVGVFREPSVYLKDGDEMAVQIEGVGLLVNTCSVLGH
ncbi:MAG: fumarylacetoacetate hydrolase family protein [Deltaproteobacteria bacterium]|nr:fumarylacetoacetate hydrolase family protein [Deltaproteobacteria bacterium]